MSPTARSLKFLRDRGYCAYVVEKWISQARKRVDLFGCIDIAAISPTGVTVGVQTTTMSNVSSHLEKISGCVVDWGGAIVPVTEMLKAANWKLHMHGWRKLADGKWHVRVQDVLTGEEVFDGR